MQVLASPFKALVLGGVLALLLLVTCVAAGAPADSHLARFLLRWLHVFAVIVWIGLVWFVNLVQLVALQELDDAGRAAIARSIAPRVALSFRHASTVTVISGFALLALNGELLQVLSMGLYGGGVASRHAILGAGVWLGLLMWALVHFAIWPALKVMLGLVAASPEAKLEARLRVRNYARINLILSLPVSVAMVAPAHLL
ncbi:MAG: hypothetical protein KDJ41_13500 [Hyphomicrobiaceae bacterium]|nr:hypothetical protein [Hyphomicrobiaceae bacterium]